MRDAPLEQDVLAATVTEDDYALWELVGMARARSADASEPELNAHAREALESLLRDGLVRVYRREGEDEFPSRGSPSVTHSPMTGAGRSPPSTKGWWSRRRQRVNASTRNCRRHCPRDDE